MTNRLFEILIGVMIAAMVGAPIYAIVVEEGPVNSKAKAAAEEFIKPLGPIDSLSCQTQHSSGCAEDKHTSCAAVLPDGTVYILNCTNTICEAVQVSSRIAYPTVEKE